MTPITIAFRALRRIRAALRPRALLLAASLFGLAAWGTGQQLQAQSGPVTIPKIQGEYDLEELKRLLEIARESGFSEEQIRKITVEDDEGNVVIAWKFIQEIERRRKAEADRVAAEKSRVYLTPRDVFDELDGQQKGDINRLRNSLQFED